jgi:hypothetical protein
MFTAACLTVLALADLPSAPPVAPRRAWWLPTVTLRLTHRDARSLSVDTDVALTPLGTTFELRLEWGASRVALPDLDP